MPIRRLSIVLLLLAALANVASAGPLEDGKRLLAEGRNADAATAFRAALKATPSSRDALLGLAKATFEGRLADSYEEVGALLREAVKAKPDDRELRLALGHHYLAWMDVDERYRADVQDQFGRLIEANAEDEDAVVGLARMYFASADSRHGLERLDALLATKPSSALALYWKGYLHYDDAEQGFKREGSRMTPEVQASFQKAYEALEASTKADAKRYDAWIRLGYTAQYLSRADETKTAAAQAAYEKALDVDGEKDPAMRGLSALLSLDSAKWIETLGRLAKDHPKAPIVHFYVGYYLKSQPGRVDEAEKAFRTYVQTARNPAAGWNEIGKILAGKGDEAGARAAFEKTLQGSPSVAAAIEAVDWLQRPLMARVEGALGSAKQAKDLVKEWEALLVLAPKHINAHNNVAFFAREAHTRTKDKALLEASVKHYEAAAELIGPYHADFETSIPYAVRHGHAQVLNDTGLMYQYEPDVKDFKKAEEFYRRAMEWSQHGYWDTYTNLVKILESEQRWADAADFAAASADGLKNADGSPNETHRAAARGDVARFEAKIPK